MFLPAIFHQNCQAVLAVVSINGLSMSLLFEIMHDAHIQSEGLDVEKRGEKSSMI